MIDRLPWILCFHSYILSSPLLCKGWTDTDRQRDNGSYTGDCSLPSSCGTAVDTSPPRPDRDHYGRLWYICVVHKVTRYYRVNHMICCLGDKRCFSFSHVFPYTISQSELCKGDNSHHCDIDVAHRDHRREHGYTAGDTRAASPHREWAGT